MEIFKLFGSILVDTDKADESISKTDNKAKGFISRLGNGIATAAKWGAGIAAAAGSVAIAVGTVAVNAADDYQKALNKLQVQTCATNEDMTELGNIIRNVYGDNFGEDMNEVAENVALVKKNLNLTGDELQNITEYALGFRDAFGYETEESTRAAKAMMDQFGISAEEAFNLMVQGEQQGLDYSGELIDSLSEYSVKFAEAGYSAEDMFNMLKSGAESGAWSLDKIGDAFKEATIRLTDGSANEALQSIGLDADELANKVATGGIASKEAFNSIYDAILKIEDPLVKQQTLISIFGTMAEDMGTEATLALLDVSDGFDMAIDSAKKMNSIQYNSFSEAIAGIKRQVESNILIPMGELVLPTLNKFANWFAVEGQEYLKKFSNAVMSIMPYVESVFLNVFNTVTGAVNIFVTAFKGQSETIKNTLSSITKNSFFSYVIEWCEYFRDVIEKLGNDTITMLIGKLSSVSSVFNALIEVLKPIAEGIIQGNIKAFDSLIYVYDALVPAVSFVIDILTELGSIILTAITPAIQKMHEAWRTFLQYFVAIVANVLVPIFSTFINMLKELLEENQDKIQKIGEIFSTVFNTIADIVTVVVDTIKDKIYPFLLDLRRSFEDNISIIKEVFKGAFDVMGGVVDTFVGTYNIVYDTIKGVIQYFNEHRTALDLLGVAIGTVTALVLAYNAASIASAVASGAETVAIMALYAADKIAAIGQGALSIATTAWTTVASIATTVTSALGSAIAFLTSPIGIAIVAIGAIIAVGVLLYKNWDKVKEKAIELWESLKEAFENIKNSISEKIETTKTIVNEKIEAIKNIFSEKFEAAKKKVSEIFETIKNVIQVSLMAIGSIIDAALQIILLPFTFIWENCKDVVVEKLTAIKDYVSEKLDEIKNFFSEKLGPVKDIVSEKFSAVKDKITETMSTVKDYVREKLNNIKTAYEENGGGVKSVVSATMEGVKQYYSIGYDAINKLTGGKLGEAVNIVSGKLEEVKNYFNEKLENVKNIVVDKFNAIKSSVQEKLSLVFNIVSEKLESIKNTMSDKINAAKNIVVDKFNAIKDSIQQKIDSAKNSVNNAVNNIKEKFNVFGEAVNTVSNIFENIKNTISDKINAAKDVVSDSINRIKNLFNFSWKLPDLKLPHFKIDGEFSLNPPSVPTLGVEWYANGGIFTEPTILSGGIGVGDADEGKGSNPEAVVPLDVLWDKLEKIANRAIIVQAPNGKELMRFLAPYKDELEKYELGR